MLLSTKDLGAALVSLFPRSTQKKKTTSNSQSQKLILIPNVLHSKPMTKVFWGN